jgi:hypothetical protein
MKGMFKNFKGLKKTKLGKPAPRSMEEITKENNQLCWELGQLEYQLFVLSKAAEEKKIKIQSLNYEAADRKNLEAESAKNSPQAELSNSATQETSQSQQDAKA